jgi:peptide-methionine (S)-S-oxide reductase
LFKETLMASSFVRDSALVLGVLALIGLSLYSLARPTAQAGEFPNPSADAPLAKAAGVQSAVFAGGCFWGIEAVFQHVDGVKSATSGYSGGDARDANYEAVSSGASGHAESVEVVFDPSKVSYGQLLKVFFSVAHDPTELNRQGPDSGPQYRSAIFYTNDEQQRIARAYIDQLEQAKVYRKRIVTTLTPLAAFYPAEEYHQDYAARHPTDRYIVFNDLPKVARLKAELPSLYRAEGQN